MKIMKMKIIIEKKAIVNKLRSKIQKKNNIKEKWVEKEHKK